MGRIRLLAAGRSSIVGNIIAGNPEPNFIAAAAAAAGVAADYSVSATVSTTFVVGLKATLVLRGRAVLPELQAGDRRPTAGLLVALTAGGA